MASPNNGKLAVLIDADNAQASTIQELLAEIARYGTASVKRAYGDWTTPNLKGWKDVLHKLAIQPMQQFNYTSGKNATDSSLIIDAMDLLHAGGLDGFCLVSSDSDFTRLATRIREAGLMVYGFGQKKTPQSFVAACDKFIYTEILKPQEAPTAQEGQSIAPLEPMLRAAMDASAREDGWSSLAGVGSMILRTAPLLTLEITGVKSLANWSESKAILRLKKFRPRTDLQMCISLSARNRPDSALVTDACGPALCAFFSAAQRGL